MEQNQEFWKFAIMLERFCSYQERCELDVNTKMTKLNVPDDLHIALLDHLKEQNMLNKLRYAISFVNGKFKYKKWGKIKIYSALAQKRLDRRSIEKALMEIDDEEYKQTLIELMDSKSEEIGGIEKDKDKKRLINYLLQKGYESNLIWGALREKERNRG